MYVVHAASCAAAYLYLHGVMGLLKAVTQISVTYRDVKNVFPDKLYDDCISRMSINNG